jgi:hypothetical protein
MFLTSNDFEGFLPAYFQVRFDAPELPWQRLDFFCIVTGHPTTGERWSEQTTQRAQLQLEAWLVRANLRFWPCAGYSPVTGHREEGFAVVLPFIQAIQLGRLFRQDAVYWVEADRLSVHRCSPGKPDFQVVGYFSNHLDGPVSATQSPLN